MQSYHAILLNTEFDASHSTQYALLSAEQHVHFRGKLWLADEN